MKTILLFAFALSNVAFADEAINESMAKFSKGLAEKYKCNVSFEVDSASISPHSNIDRKSIMAVAANAEYPIRNNCKAANGQYKGVDSDVALIKARYSF